MAVAQAILWMLLAVALSDVFVRVSPLRIPLPFVQILLGVALELTGISEHLDFSPEVFFLVFLAPLLFADAVRMPRRELFAMRRAILGLAVGLVGVTVLGAGYLVDWLAPAVPLAVCCALGAVLSPTDAVAVSALAGPLGMPKRLIHLLRGEALLNDASGVMALQTAILVAGSGQLKADQAVLQFLFMSLGGLTIGALIGALMGKAGSWLSARGMEDPSGQALLTLSIPFAAFSMAEGVHASGILAAVAAGVSYNAFGLNSPNDSPLRLQSRGLWHTIEFTLNGLIFVLLGLELPGRIGHIPRGLSLAEVWYFPPLIVLMLYATRWIWCWFWMRSALKSVNARVLAAMTLSGVRGAVSLAAVLSLPAAFQARDLVVFLALAVILLTLVVAAVALPLVLRGLELPDQDRDSREEVAAREALLEEAERVLDAQCGGELRKRLLDLYRTRLQGEAEEEERLRRSVLEAQRERLSGLLKQRKINDAVHGILEHELDLQGASLQSGPPIH
ncbi:Na+/H+ antiporter [bacterium SCN 62-11]|nr:MAG: Na+/H+ antiporter [bacterium SCN 62-11]